MSSGAAERHPKAQPALGHQTAVTLAPAVSLWPRGAHVGRLAASAELFGLGPVHQHHRQTQALKQLVREIGQEQEQAATVAPVRCLDLGRVPVRPADALVELRVGEGEGFATTTQQAHELIFGSDENRPDAHAHTPHFDAPGD